MQEEEFYQRKAVFEMKRAYKQAAREGTCMVISLDFMQNPPLPRIRTNNSWYCVFGVHDLADDSATTYVYTETVVTKGANEVTSTLLHYFNSKVISADHLVLLSDGCSGQNENHSVVYFQYILVHRLFKKIIRVFPMIGYSCLPNDQDFALVENKIQTTIRLEVPVSSDFRMPSSPQRAAVAERLARSPPTKVNRVQSPAGSPDYRKWESCRTMSLVGVFSRGSPVPPALSFQRYIMPQSPLSALKTLLLKAVQISSILPLKLNLDEEATAATSHQNFAFLPILATCLESPSRTRYYTVPDPVKACARSAIAAVIPASRGPVMEFPALYGQPRQAWEYGGDRPRRRVALASCRVSECVCLRRSWRCPPAYVSAAPASFGLRGAATRPTVCVRRTPGGGGDDLRRSRHTVRNGERDGALTLSCPRYLRTIMLEGERDKIYVASIDKGVVSWMKSVKLRAPRDWVSQGRVQVVNPADPPPDYTHNIPASFVAAPVNLVQKVILSSEHRVQVSRCDLALHYPNALMTNRIAHCETRRPERCCSRTDVLERNTNNMFQNQFLHGAVICQTSIRRLAGRRPDHDGIRNKALSSSLFNKPAALFNTRGASKKGMSPAHRLPPANL
ncbi:hypothetical protein PR048_029137 [Dryococelus australis]|uniref:Uncharacterized protein n=1 Tax=Dryococelus australis TaxID=614101 RepID=A0ABQ9GCJ0_9NEOP|nr:hypothetical protein PR048_029137 [Dryococelus australis]